MLKEYTDMPLIPSIINRFDNPSRPRTQIKARTRTEDETGLMSKTFR